MRCWWTVQGRAASEKTRMYSVLGLFAMSGRFQRYQKVQWGEIGCSHNLHDHRSRQGLGALPDSLHQNISQPECRSCWPRHSSNNRFSVKLRSEIRSIPGLHQGESSCMQDSLIHLYLICMEILEGVRWQICTFSAGKRNKGKKYNCPYRIPIVFYWFNLTGFWKIIWNKKRFKIKNNLIYYNWKGAKWTSSCKTAYSNL